MRNSKMGHVVLTVLAACVFLVLPIQAQTFAVLHTFVNRIDGATPYGSVGLDSAGNLYGTASAGGFTGNNCSSFSGCGTVFKLTHRGSGWIFTSLYAFQGNMDASVPYSGVTIGPNGSLYGTTIYGGASQAGAVYNLQPPAHTTRNTLGGWTDTVLYGFGGGSDGAYPLYGSLVFDRAGNIYGTTSDGGFQCFEGQYCGTMFELTRSGGNWTKSSFSFGRNNDGGDPQKGVVLDASGNVYGTTGGSIFNGVVYELSSTQQGWGETTLYGFEQGVVPASGIIPDGTGGFFGTAGNTIYQLSQSGSQWNYNPLYAFSANVLLWSGLVRDASGNLFGATYSGGVHGQGSVFKLTPSQGGWTETDLHDFTGGGDGSFPIGGITVDANGNLFGTASAGGTNGCGGSGCGVVWEITP